MIMDFDDLPVEILQQIGATLPYPDIASLARCAKRFRDVFAPLLYADIELRLLYTTFFEPVLLYPRRLVETPPAVYLTGTRSLSILGLDYPGATKREDFHDHDCLKLEGPTDVMIMSVVEFAGCIPAGKLQTFEYKCNFVVDGDFFVKILGNQSRITSLALCLQSLMERTMTKQNISRIILPHLRRLHLHSLQADTSYEIASQILQSSKRITEIDLHRLIQWSTNPVQSHIREIIYPEIVRHRPHILRLSGFTLHEALFECFDTLEELHLRHCEMAFGISVDRNLQLKRLLIVSTYGYVRFWRDEILQRIQPGLESLHLIVQINDPDFARYTRERIPVNTDCIIRHKDTLRHLSLFEYTSDGALIVDRGVPCDDELLLFQQLKLKEYATGLNFRVQQRTSAYWRTFENNPVDAKYAHFASLEKLYVIPDIVPLQTQIDNEQRDFWDLNPRNMFTFQMASIVLTNIGFYAQEMPKIRYIIVGKGNYLTGQKVYEVTWLEHMRLHRAKGKGPQPKYKFAISTAYELSEMRAEGVQFPCFEGTRFSDLVEDTRNRTFLS